MGFLGALLGAAPTVLAGAAKGKRQLEQTQYDRASKAQDDAMKEAARQQAMQQALMEFQAQEQDRKLTRDLGIQQHGELMKRYQNQDRIAEQHWTEQNKRQTEADKAEQAWREKQIALGYANLGARQAAVDGKGANGPDPKRRALAQSLLPTVAGIMKRLDDYNPTGDAGLLQGLATGAAETAAVPGHGFFGKAAKAVAQLTPEKHKIAFQDAMRAAEFLKQLTPGNRAFEDTQAQAEQIIQNPNVRKDVMDVLTRMASGQDYPSEPVPGVPTPGAAPVVDLAALRARNAARKVKGTP